MTVVVIVEAVLLVVAFVYIVALLRSHADILRRLSALEDGSGGRAAGSGSGFAGAAGSGSARRRPEGAEIVPATDIFGVTAAGDSVKLSLGAGSPSTLLAFLSTGCTSCEPLWAGLREPEQAAALGDRIVIVTHDPDRESPARLRRLAPPGIDLIMADAAWQDYKVPSSPHFVLTDGAGGIAGRGTALSWSQLLGMMGDARADAALAAADAAQAAADAAPTAAGGVPATADDAQAPAHPAASLTVEPARTTAERAARAEQALARAGIGPGHPSLYPGGPAEPGEPR